MKVNKLANMADTYDALRKIHPDTVYLDPSGLASAVPKIGYVQVDVSKKVSNAAKKKAKKQKKKPMPSDDES